MVTPTVVTAPSVLPVSLAEAKAQCRIASDFTGDDSLLEIYIAAARDYFEGRTSRTLHQTKLRYVLGGWPTEGYIELPRATPLISITSAQYVDSDGVAHDIADDATWIADTYSTPGRLVLAYNESWPSFTAYPVAPIRIEYTCGIATASPVTEAPGVAKIPILMLVGGMYENRESVVVSDGTSIAQIAVDYGVEAFLADPRNMARYEF